MKIIVILFSFLGLLLNTLHFEKKVSLYQSIYPYYGVLEIPTIDLQQGFYTYNAVENDVDKNIELISHNCHLNQACNFILASHSGNAEISYFKNLDKLKLNDKAIVYLDNQKYYYILTEIQYQEKKGNIFLSKPKESQLVLTTCNKDKQNIQNIYIFKQEKK